MLSVLETAVAASVKVSCVLDALIAMTTVTKIQSSVDRGVSNFLTYKDTSILAKANADL